jgi:hypothetical protein
VIVALAVLAVTPAAADEPPPLSAADAAIFLDSPADAIDKPDCPEGRRPDLTCKDETSYVHTNEWHAEEWKPFIAGAGGGYVGVGSDQGLTFAAWSRAELAWFIDYDPEVVATNRVIRAFLLRSDDPAAFVARWAPDRRSRAAAVQILEDEYAADPERAEIVRVYRKYRRSLERHWGRVLKRRQRGFHFLHDAADYAYARALHRAGRIRILGADLLADGAVRGIAAAATRLAVPIRVLYLSNAEQWPYPQTYRDNIAALPFDARSVVLRALWGSRRWGAKLGPYFYVAQAGADFQAKVRTAGVRRVGDMMDDRVAVKDGVFTVGMTATPP